MRRFGLLGYPLTHSFSQNYFTGKFAQLGLIDCVYENFSLPDIGLLHDVLKRHQDLQGFNITIPYKKQVLSFLNNSTEAVTAMGACNCVRIKDGLLTGYNTDVVGFEQSIKPFLKSHHTKALILGTGGASAAVEFVLKKMNIDVQYVSRTPSNGSVAYEGVTKEMMHDHTLIINTTPLGMYPNVHDFPAIPYHYITSAHHLYDLVYNPAETRFLSLGKERGASVQNGYEMLVLQAEESWRIWNE